MSATADSHVEPDELRDRGDDADETDDLKAFRSQFGAVTSPAGREAALKEHYAGNPGAQVTLIPRDGQAAPEGNDPTATIDKFMRRG